MAKEEFPIPQLPIETVQKAEFQEPAEVLESPESPEDRVPQLMKPLPETKIELGRPEFHIDLRPKFVKLPELKDKTSIDVRYPLISPFAVAHIFWDKNNNELIYALEEPVLTKTETEVLKLIQIGLEEMINVSYIRAAKMNILLQYLEKNVQSIILEIGIKVSRETYQKIMYFIYRDAAGLNKIEPLMYDYYIEDIECNGVGFPIYIVHRKFENIKTNIQFDKSQELIDFVEKLAQKSGRYVSYAKPLLDGTLPDGSRVNATYTEDITTRGPTFTIRKFTKDPWTPIHLIDHGTAIPEVFAYLWIAVEYKFNVMVIGETAAGKTTFLNALLYFVPPEARVCSIEDTRELNLAHDNWLPAVTRSGFGIPNASGAQYGEITLFDLLKETFRQNPDYVVVGEIRGKEAYVLFQGMASGHPSFGTFHAASVESLVRRLQTPPISLPSSLVESLDIICVTTHIKDQNRSIRRLKRLNEIKSVSQELGKVDSNVLFEWNPVTDQVISKGNSVVLERISRITGQTVKELNEELARRTKLLTILHKRGIFNFKDVTTVISAYYKDKKHVLKEFGI
ncbi:MAG: type II/IV secretion system ATPase subunit [Nanoarchaeota archaeon]|nr:type II/IV secretion system ATPase subunit [Nanoarchaeota archaeon]